MKNKSKNNLPQSEKKLFDLVTLLKNIYDISPGLICVANANTGYFTECNQAVTSNLGWSVKEFKSRPFDEFIHPDDRQRTIDVITEQLKGKPLANFQNRYLCKDGSYKWLAWQATAADKDGKVFAVATNITERKQAEEELKRSEQKLHVSLKESNITAFIQDVNLVYTWVYNPAPGLTPEMVIGKTDMDLIPPNDLKPLLKLKKRVLNTGRGERDTVSFTIDNSKSYFDTVIEPLLDSDKSIIGISGVSTDITEQKLVEEKLSENRNLYKILVESLMERIKELSCLYDISNIIEKSNVKLNEIYQKTVNRIPGGWHYPEITCARIAINDKEYKTKNYTKSKWIQSSDIFTNSDKIGVIEVLYLKKCPKLNEGPFLREERNLINAIARILGIVTERKQEQEALQTARTNLEQKVKERTSELLKNERELEQKNILLNEKNIALNEIMKQIKDGRDHFESQIKNNVERFLIPLLDNAISNESEKSSPYLNLLKENLRDLTGSFGEKITDQMLRLTPKEIEICNMIKNGLSTKNISKILNISIRTVDTHRYKIRQKLEINRKDINLTTYLKSI